MGKMKTIGILTFHWADDYGGMLQAYALKRRLELMGHQAELIPYAPVKLTGRYWLCPLYAASRDGRVDYFFGRRMLIRNLSQGWRFWCRRRRMRSFRRTFLTAKPPIRSVKGISLQNYQTVLVGSDQVWNPEITVGLDDAYIGSIPGRGRCRLVSYGASLGGNPLSEAERQRFAQYVGGFSAVSLRERTDADRIERLLGRKVEDVLDPVLLLERPEWERVGRPPAERDYILLYSVQCCDPLWRCAQALSARLGKKLVTLSDPRLLSDSAAGDVQIRTQCGPAEFVGYLQNAACVLTNSFHGTAFSILLEKPFLTFPHNTRSIRQEDLLRKLGLLSHMVGTVQPEELPSLWAQTDWEGVRAHLAQERRRSERFLEENI